MLSTKYFFLIIGTMCLVRSAAVESRDIFHNAVDDVFQNETYHDTSLATKDEGPGCPCPCCKHVAFTARLGTSQMNVGVKQNIAFDDIVVNAGGGYRRHHSVFVAPKTGLYQFSCTLMSHASHVFAEMVHEGTVVSRIHAYANTGYSGTQTVVIEVAKGDEVLVRNNNQVTSIRGDYFSTFSGHLLSHNPKPDPNPNPNTAFGE